ncbi:MAG: hypothetical protein ACJ8GN_16555 [Longimicrobiaceae bacterium]
MGRTGLTMEPIRIDVSGAPEGGFSLYGAARLAWTLLVTGIVAAPVGGIAYSVSERPEYLFIPYAIALPVWLWLVIIRPKQKEKRVQAYGRSLTQVRSALRAWRGGAHRARYFWLGANVIAAVVSALAVANAGPQMDALGFLAVLFLLNGVRLWNDKSSALKALSAWVLILIVWLAALTIWSALFAERQEGDDVMGMLGFVTMIVLFGIALSMTRRIAPWSQATMREMRKRDLRPPVLFLRSFNDEAQPILRGGGPSLERVLTDSVRAYGPFIGIGRPGELRPAGAAREYFPHDRWQAAVLKLMDEAAFIIVLLGFTAGLDWEIQRVAERGHQRKTIFVLPPTERTERFARLRTVLPETLEGARLTQADLSTALTLHLTRDWNWAIAYSDYVSDAEYQAAVDVAVFGLLCQDQIASTGP